MATYITKMFDRLDKIVELRFGSTNNQMVEYVISQNPGIENFGLLLPPGITVFIPDRPSTNKSNSVPEIKQIRLFD